MDLSVSLAHDQRVEVNSGLVMTNPATAIAENDDKRPADLVMTDDCRVDRQIW